MKRVTKEHRVYANRERGEPEYVVQQVYYVAKIDGLGFQAGHDPIKQVVFETYDSDLGMTVETAVHWTNAIAYMLRKWPAYGAIKAVITENGKRMHASSRHPSFDTHHPDSMNGWNVAPDLLRKTCMITDLYGSPLVVIKGHAEWCYHRDNARFQQELEQKEPV